MTAAHVYVHIPFCARRCSYCDFAIAVRRVTPVHAFVDGIARELDRRFPAPETTPVRTLYFGGGTPSQLGADGIARLMDVLRARWCLVPGAEVTLEANPENVDPATVRAWQAAGVNRVSLGAQSFDDRVLTWMHRTHDASGIRRAAEALHASGLVNWSLDLIFALPPEVPRNWAADLAAALSLAPPHLSAYGLSVEPATPVARWRSRGLVSGTKDAAYEAEFLAVHDVLGAAGYDHYEVSNFARPGHRAIHNSAYWERVPYVGLGPSAHELTISPAGRVRRWNRPNYAEWLAVLRGGADPLEGQELLSDTSELVETVFLGLRSSIGVTLRSAPEYELVKEWVRQGWATLTGDMARLTARGWLRMDALVTALTHLRSRY